MGLKLFGGNCSVYPSSANVKAPNPDPANFKILEVYRVNKHLVAVIHYPDCTNYEGKKVCLYLNTTEKELFMKKRLDPHFSEDGFSPFARFKPTQQGASIAIQLAKKLQE